MSDQPTMNEQPPAGAAIVFHEPAPGSLDVQISALARVLARIARRVATKPAQGVQSDQHAA